MIKILIVDDEMDVELLFLQKFRKELKNGEFFFHFAHDGVEALQFIRALEPFDLVLVLSDINMPQMTGLELLKNIQKERPTLKVIMITAYGDSENRNKAYELGAVDLINKPVDFIALKEKMIALASENKVNY